MNIVEALARATVVHLHAPISQGAGAFTSTPGVDLSGYEGVVTAVVTTGTITGTLSLIRLQDSADNSVFADITGATAADVTTASQVRTISVDVRAIRRFLRFGATVTTGPVLMGVALVGFRKYIS